MKKCTRKYEHKGKRERKKEQSRKIKMTKLRKGQLYKCKISK